MRKFRILSLDGGGIRGTFAAAFLAEIERQLKVRMADHFDLIAGTSTGGIIGIGLALGVPAERIESFYQSKGPRVFQKRQSPSSSLVQRAIGWGCSGAAAAVGGWRGIVIRLLVAPACRWLFECHFAKLGFDFNSLLRTRYESRELERALHEVLGVKTLEQAATRIIVPAVDLTCGKPVVFKSPHLPEACSRDKDFSAVQIAMATAAAPTYFPHVTIRDGSAYCDGGLWANNPVLLAVAEAERIFRSGLDGDPFGEIERADLEVLSIGTGRGRYSITPPDLNAGLLWWGPRILDVMSSSLAAGTQNTARFILGDQLHRVDFDVPDATWALDGIEHVDQLIHMGREKAHEHLAELRPLFAETRGGAVTATASQGQ